MNYQIGMMGLGVMGHNLAQNILRNGFSVAGYDLDPVKTAAFVNASAGPHAVLGAASVAEMFATLQTPRQVFMMVPAGAPVDGVIALLLPHLQPGDLLVDGGNSHFLDTERRARDLEAKGINFLGVGISGGEEGALWGPSIMPGGQRHVWESFSPVLQAIAAKAEDGQPCVEYMGPRGAGHYVKMVHNGIEYGDMQLIAEIYDILRRGLKLDAPGLHNIFAQWNAGVLKSYLIEITADIFTKVDLETCRPLVDVILDEAQQKGTGKWASQNALDISAPIPTIHAALEGRILSAMKAERVAASKILSGPSPVYQGTPSELIRATENALYASKVISYAQGLGMLAMASAQYGYNLQPGEIARIWRAGCIIRASLLEDIMASYTHRPDLPNLLLDDGFKQAVQSRQQDLRNVVQAAIGMGIPVPALSASLAYYDAYRSECLPANLTQAQRDYFGAHTYRRTDRDGIFHTDWTAEP